MRDKWQYGSTLACMVPSQQKCGPNEWQLVPGFLACGQQGTQSPIDLAFATASTPPTEMSLPNPLRLKQGRCNVAEFVLNEHTDEVSIHETCKDTYSLPFVTSTTDAMEKTFNLYQFHYHSPSEHTWDGKYFPMEVHHVHHADDGQALVIAVFVAEGTPQGFEEVQRANFLLEIQSLVPPVNVSLASAAPDGNVWKERVENTPNLDVYSKFIDMSGGYLYYDGSFTTPPCTPSTHWIIVPKPVVVPQSTIDLYRKVINSNPNNQLTPCFGSSASPFHADAGNVVWDASLGCDNRPIQPLRGVNNLMRQLYSVPIGNATYPPGTDARHNSGVSPWVWLALLVVVALALLGVATFLLKRRGKEEESDMEYDDSSS